MVIRNGIVIKGIYRVLKFGDNLFFEIINVTLFCKDRLEDFSILFSGVIFKTNVLVPPTFNYLPFRNTLKLRLHWCIKFPQETGVIWLALFYCVSYIKNPNCQLFCPMYVPFHLCLFGSTFCFNKIASLVLQICISDGYPTKI